jgi:hypothetical protein
MWAGSTSKVSSTVVRKPLTALISEESYAV